MTDEQAQAFQDADAAAHEGVAELLERVADKLGQHATVRAAFGEPVDRDGVTVIPVAQTLIGTGAGGGTSPTDEFGTGAGGGAITRPLGYIRFDGADAVFVPLKAPWRDPILVLAYATIVLILSRAVVRLVRG